MQKIKPAYLIITICILIGITVYVYMPRSVQKATEDIVSEIFTEPIESEDGTLALPFAISEIDTQDGLFSPFGVYRRTGDLVGLGHDGIDIPLVAGANIYAAYKGKIVSIKPSDDKRPGYSVKLIFDKPNQGEAVQGFYYENITPLNNIKEGSKVAKGELIGKNALGKYANTHFQLSDWYGNLEYSRNAQCWIGLVNDKDRNEFLTLFSQLSTKDYFINAWSTTTEEGKYTYKNLLDKENYPQGPALCYPPGTDGRVTL